MGEDVLVEVVATRGFGVGAPGALVDVDAARIGRAGVGIFALRLYALAETRALPVI